MQTSEKQQEQQRELHTKLWAIANDLRGNMEANEFKNYILGLIFYRYLSEKVENRVKDLLSEDDISYEEAYEDEEYREEVNIREYSTGKLIDKIDGTFFSLRNNVDWILR